MATTTTTATAAAAAPRPTTLSPAPTAGPKRAAVLLQRSVAALLPSGTRSTPQIWIKDDILDALYWIRQVAAILAGPVAGLAGARGVSTFALFVTSAASAGLSWARAVGVDEEDVGGVGALLGEGLSQAIALFVLLWSLFYSVTGGGIL